MSFSHDRFLSNVLFVVVVCNAVSTFLIGGALFLHLFTRAHP